MNENFEELVKRFQEGDQYAFEEIYTKCYGYLTFVCQKFSRSREDIEEIVNDTFQIAYQNCSQLRGDTLLAYLRKIAVNLCYKYYQKNKKHYDFVFCPLDQVADLAETNINYLPEQNFEAVESHHELLQLISQLPLKQQNVLYLYYYVGMTTDELAKMLSCSKNTIHKTLQRARDALQNKYSQSMATLPLILLAEETAFAATCTPATIPAFVATAAPVVPAVAVATVGVNAKIYTIVICVLLTCITATVTYFALRDAEYMPVAVIELYAPYHNEEGTEPKIATEPPLPTEPATIAITTTQLQSEVEEVQSPPDEAWGYDGVEANNNDVEQPAGDTEPDEDFQLDEENIELEPDDGYITNDEPTIELVTTPQTQPMQLIPPTTTMPDEIEYAPEPIDRTQYILAALEAATTEDCIAHIIYYFSFIFTDQIRSSAYEQLRFYVTNEGSGDILIGIAMFEDGTNWRINFQFFEDDQMPTDTMDLWRFMIET